MTIKPKYTFYLCGNMEFVSLKTAHGWRDVLTKALEKHYGEAVQVVNPCKTESKKLEHFLPNCTDLEVKEFLKQCKKRKDWNKFLPVVEAIINFDLADIARANAIIAYLDFKTMSGSYAEMWEALRVVKIPIYVFTDVDLVGANSWMLATAMLSNPRKKIYATKKELLLDLFKDFPKEIHKGKRNK